MTVSAPRDLGAATGRAASASAVTITDGQRLLSDSLTSLRHWRVWLFLGLQDVKARFRRSVIGPLWILLNLLIFVGAAGFVYGVMFGQAMDEFLPFLITGVTIWSFVVATLSEAGSTFIGAEGYIKQFSYPKQIYLLRGLVNYLVNLLIGFGAIVPMQIFFGRFDWLGWVYCIPGLVLLVISGLGHIAIGAYLGTRFRDWPYALSGLLQVLFFLTPIMFPVKILQDRKLDFVYQYNPLYYLIDVVRHPITTGTFAPIAHYGYALVYAAIVWGLAALVARALDRRLVFLL